MAYTVKLAAKAERQLGDLPAHIRKRVARWIGLLAEDPYRSPSRQLEGYPQLRRVHASKDYVIVVTAYLTDKPKAGEELWPKA